MTRSNAATMWTLAAAALLLTACSDYARPGSAASARLPPDVTADCTLVGGNESTIAAGRIVYGGSCIHCHGPGGKGLSGSVPPLAGAERLAAQPMLAVNAMVANQISESPVHGMAYNDMVATLGSLTDDEIAGVLTYVLTSWGNCHAIIEPRQVAARRAGGA